MHSRNDSIAVDFLEASVNFQSGDVWLLYLMVMPPLLLLCIVLYQTSKNPKSQDIE